MVRLVLCWQFASPIQFWLWHFPIQVSVPHSQKFYFLSTLNFSLLRLTTVPAIAPFAVVCFPFCSVPSCPSLFWFGLLRPGQRHYGGSVVEAFEVSKHELKNRLY